MKVAFTRPGKKVLPQEFLYIQYSFINMYSFNSDKIMQLTMSESLKYPVLLAGVDFAGLEIVVIFRS